MRRAVGLVFLLLFPTAGQADELADQLRTLRSVKPGGDTAAARAAWKEVVGRGPKALPAILEAMDTPDTVAANWLRLAYDELAESALKAGGKGLDTGALLAFARDERKQGRARRLALETVERLRPGEQKRFLKGRLSDPEFGYDAIEQRLAEVKGAPREEALPALREAFAATRELEQSRAAAARLEKHGEPVSVAEHMGFLGDWYVIGPFDGKGGAGFKSVYPPERNIDLKEEPEGKKGEKLRWKRLTVPEAKTGRFPILVDLRPTLGEAHDAVGYAYTELRVPAAQTVEMRGSADDNLSVWVNGKRVFAFEEYRNGVRLDRHRFRVELKAGVNRVLVKVCQAPFDPNSPEPNWEFLLRITDLNGRGLTFRSALPPAGRKP
jgi:hypothetical protein